MQVMIGDYESFDEVDTIESFDEFDGGAEASVAFRPGRKIFAPGGLASATLHTPKGPAKLNLPSPVPTLTQFRTLEQALNANTQRLNLAYNELARVRRQLAVRRADPQTNMMSMFLMLKLSKDFKQHKHKASDGTVDLPADSGGLSSFLPLLMLQPNLFGQPASGSATPGAQDPMSSPIMMFVLMDLL
jgi:hypothetical protein